MPSIINHFVFTEDELDISEVINNPSYMKRVGLECKHYTVLSLYAVKRNTYNTSYTPYYRVQCKYNPAHKPIVPYTDIDRYQNIIRCPCHDKVRRQGVVERSNDKYAGEIIAGCECLRRSENDDNWSMPVFVYTCPYCGKEFERRRISMLNFHRSHKNVNAGCDDCLKDHHLMFRSKWTKEEIREAATDELNRIWQRTHNPFFPHYKDYGGRGIKMSPWWDPAYGQYSRDECIDHMVQFMEDNGWEPGLELDRINANGDYTPNNCRWIDKSMQYDNRRITLCAQFGSIVYIGREFNSVYHTSIGSMRKDKRKAVTGQVNMYNRLYGSKLDIFVCLQKDGTFRDNNGFLVLMPPLKIFPRYPDDINPPVDTYQEYLERLAFNLANKVETRVPVGDNDDLSMWVTEEDLLSVGITDLNAHADLLTIMRHVNGDKD